VENNKRSCVPTQTENMKTATPEPALDVSAWLRPGRRSLHHVSFFCQAPDVQHVTLVGDFNGWQPSANPMRQMPDGCWIASLELPHGHHQYLFLVDGNLALDPKASGRTRNERNEPVSLIAVS
jgi:1,4-alpha-glucan branching enzyme